MWSYAAAKNVAVVFEWRDLNIMTVFTDTLAYF